MLLKTQITLIEFYYFEVGTLQEWRLYALYPWLCKSLTVHYLYV